MEHLYQMKVVSGALPEIDPTIDLQVIARTLPADCLGKKKVFKAVQPAVDLRPKQVIPILFFHSHESSFSLLMSSFLNSRPSNIRNCIQELFILTRDCIQCF